MLSKIMNILSLPIIILNIFGGIVGVIWLIFLGEWKLITIGILLVLTSHWIISILMIPSLPLIGIAAYFYEIKSFWRYVFAFISKLYENILIIATCIFAFYLCSSFYNGDIGVGYIPYLLWSWVIALSPWQFIASKNPDNEFSPIIVFNASVFYLLFLISIFINSLLVKITIIIFAVVQLIAIPIFILITIDEK